MTDRPLGNTEIRVLTRKPSYACMHITGECGPHVTKGDIEKQLWGYFGGRDTRLQNGKFSTTKYTD